MAAGGDFGRERLSRRELLRRAGIAGANLVWAVPVIQSLTPAAYAQGGGCCQFVGACITEVRSECEADFGSFKKDEVCDSACGQCRPPGGTRCVCFTEKQPRSPAVPCPAPPQETMANGQCTGTKMGCCGPCQKVVTWECSEGKWVSTGIEHRGCP